MLGSPEEVLLPVSPLEPEVAVEGDLRRGVIGRVGSGHAGNEASEPRVLKDPGRPKSDEVEHSNVTQLPFISCPSCAGGNPRDRMHRRQPDSSQKMIPDVALDCGWPEIEGP